MGSETFLGSRRCPASPNGPRCNCLATRVHPQYYWPSVHLQWLHHHVNGSPCLAVPRPLPRPSCNLSLHDRVQGAEKKGKNLLIFVLYKRGATGFLTGTSFFFFPQAEAEEFLWRIGPLNCYSPMKPDRFYDLDLTHRDDREVCKVRATEARERRLGMLDATRFSTLCSAACRKTPWLARVRAVVLEEFRLCLPQGFLMKRDC